MIRYLFNESSEDMAKYWILLDFFMGDVYSCVPCITTDDTYLVLSSGSVATEYNKDGVLFKRHQFLDSSSSGNSTVKHISKFTDMVVTNDILYTENISSVRALQGITSRYTGYYDSTTNHIYVSGREVVSTAKGFIAKLTTTGSVVWRRYFSVSTETQDAHISCVDTAGNVCVLSTAGNTTHVLKFNSSGTLTSKVVLSGTGVASSIKYNPYDGNIYIVRATNVVKLNSSLVVQSSVGLTSQVMTDICFDVDGSYYLTSRQGTFITLAKMSDADNLLFGRKIEETYLTSKSAQWQIVGCTFDATENAVVVHSSAAIFVFSASAQKLLAKLKSDGTGTGTYGTVSYSDYTLTTTSPGITASASTIVDTNSTSTLSPISTTNSYTAKGVTYVS